jgi:hypothetical protein
MNFGKKIIIIKQYHTIKEQKYFIISIILKINEKQIKKNLLILVIII